MGMQTCAMKSLIKTLGLYKGKKGKVTVSSPHPGSELCSADWQVPSLVTGPFQSVYIHLDIHLDSLGSMQPLIRNFAPRLTNLPSQVPICSWVKRSNASWSALLRGTMKRSPVKVLNQGIDLDPDPVSCMLPLDQPADISVHKWFIWDCGSLVAKNGWN